MDNWKSISGAICLNIFMGLVEHEPKKIDDLILPLCCGLYLSDHWHQLSFSKTDTIKELRSYTSNDVLTMKDMLIANQGKIKNQIIGYSDHLNGSLAFAVVIIQTMYNGNQGFYKNNLKTLFQECWEVIFWFIQDLDNDSIKSMVCEYSDNHIPVFNKVLTNINNMNPV